jgi:hypothetical protein
MKTTTEKQYVNAEGKYLAKVKQPGNGWLGETSSGKQFIRVPLIITDEGPQKDREVVWQGYLTEAAEERTFKTLNELFGLGWTFDALFAGKVSWAGALVSVTVTAEEYNGETRYKAKWINPPSKKADVEEDEVAGWDKKLAAIRGTAPAPAMKTKTEDGDDIPF